MAVVWRGLFYEMYLQIVAFKVFRTISVREISHFFNFQFCRLPLIGSINLSHVDVPPWSMFCPLVPGTLVNVLRWYGVTYQPYPLFSPLQTWGSFLLNNKIKFQYFFGRSACFPYVYDKSRRDSDFAPWHGWPLFKQEGFLILIGIYWFGFVKIQETRLLCTKFPPFPLFFTATVMDNLSGFL